MKQEDALGRTLRAQNDPNNGKKVVPAYRENLPYVIACHELPNIIDGRMVVPPRPRTVKKMPNEKRGINLLFR